jgi:hypothetical protein
MSSDDLAKFQLEIRSDQRAALPAYEGGTVGLRRDFKLNSNINQQNLDQINF